MITGNSIANRIVPTVVGIIFIGFALFSKMDRLRDGTHILDPRRRTAWRAFFFLLGLLCVLFGLLIVPARVSK
jgi:hypothetical protein